MHPISRIPCADTVRADIKENDVGGGVAGSYVRNSIVSEVLTPLENFKSIIASNM